MKKPHMKAPPTRHMSAKPHIRMQKIKPVAASAFPTAAAAFPQGGPAGAPDPGAAMGDPGGGGMPPSAAPGGMTE